MKKTQHFLLTFILALIWNFGYAQDDVENRTTSSSDEIRLGARIGGVLNTFNHAQPHIGEKAGAVASFWAEKYLSNKFSVQGELSYLQQGGTYAKYIDNTVPGDLPYLTMTSSKITAQYADLAILGKYQLVQIDGIRINITAGGAFGYNIGVINKYERTYYDSRMFYTVDSKQMITQLFEPYQVGAVGGLGSEMNVAGKRLIIDFRYRYGLTPAMKSFSYIDLPTVATDIYTNSFYVMIGIGF